MTRCRAGGTGSARDGKVNVPLEKAPWGDTFGMCTDKYGINWLVNIAGAAEPTSHPSDVDPPARAALEPAALVRAGPARRRAS